jgi:dUTP pyrophosphatase
MNHAAKIPVRIRRLDHAKDLPVPSRQTEHAAGLDLRAAVATPIEIKPMQTLLIPCGFAMEIPAGYEVQVRARSGLSSRHGLTLINGTGTIDADYRGEISVPLVNLGSKPYTITRGERVAQMIVHKLPDIEIIESDELSDTERGQAGFGSTGGR